MFAVTWIWSACSWPVTDATLPDRNVEKEVTAPIPVAGHVVLEVTSQVYSRPLTLSTNEPVLLVPPPLLTLWTRPSMFTLPGGSTVGVGRGVRVAIGDGIEVAVAPAPTVSVGEEPSPGFPLFEEPLVGEAAVLEPELELGLEEDAPVASTAPVDPGVPVAGCAAVSTASALPVTPTSTAAKTMPATLLLNNPMRLLPSVFPAFLQPCVIVFRRPVAFSPDFSPMPAEVIPIAW